MTLDEAWAEAEAALPEFQPPDPNYATDWLLSLERDVDPPYYRARAIDRTRSLEDQTYHGVCTGWLDTPVAALDDLVVKLRGPQALGRA